MSNHISAIKIPNYKRIREDFCQELSLSSQGCTSSLPFIRNSLPKHSLVVINDTFQAFVIGGTSGEAATVQYLSNGRIKILNQE